MDRMACVDVPALPLQLLFRRHPDWASHPTAVVDRDKPSGVIEWVNGPARAYHILPGMRYAAGLALSRRLRGVVVPRAEIDEGIALVTQRLWSFSPRIEPSPRETGIFWLDATGLRHVYPSLDTWASCIRSDLSEVGFTAVVAIGFSRFGSYAAARAGESIVFQCPEQERAYLRGVPLACLALEPGFRDTLLKLGVRTIGAFLELPSSGIRRRFGPEAEELHRLARGEGWVPLMPIRFLGPVEGAISFEYPENDLERLLATVARRLDPLLAELSGRHEALASLRLTLTLDDRSERREEVSPATPATATAQIIPLIRLRLEPLTLPSGVIELGLHALGEKTSPQQLGLFMDASPQHLEAAERGIAQVRAQLGDSAVVCGRIEDGHLPEARFTWEPLRRLAAPKPSNVAIRPLMRRIYSPPVVLPPRDRHAPEGWMVAGAADGPVEEMIGPYALSGAWWANEISRVYYFARTRSGRLLWIYHDQRRRCWFLHGEVQ